MNLVRSWLRTWSRRSKARFAFVIPMRQVTRLCHEKATLKCDVIKFSMTGGQITRDTAIAVAVLLRKKRPRKMMLPNGLCNRLELCYRTMRCRG